MRLTWKEIQERYPDQWVGLVDVMWEKGNASTINSAVVKYTDKSKDELAEIQIMTNGEVISRFTTPENVLFVGTMW